MGSVSPTARVAFVVEALARASRTPVPDALFIAPRRELRKQPARSSGCYPRASEDDFRKRAVVSADRACKRLREADLRQYLAAYKPDNGEPTARSSGRPPSPHSTARF